MASLTGKTTRFIYITKVFDDDGVCARRIAFKHEEDAETCRELLQKRHTGTAESVAVERHSVQTDVTHGPPTPR